MGPIQRRLQHFVLRVVAHPRLTLGIAAIFVAASIVLAITRLHISTDQNKLFSTNVKFFRDYLEFDDKFPENEALYVIVEASDPKSPPPVKRWVELANAIESKLRQMPEQVISVDSHVPIDKLGSQGILFEDRRHLPEIFEELKRFSTLVRLAGEAPNLLTRRIGDTPVERILTTLSLTPSAETTPFVSMLAQSLNSTINTGVPILPDLGALDAADPSRLGYYYVSDETNPAHKVLLIRVYPKVDYNSLTAISDTVEAIRSAVKHTRKPFKEFSAGITGRPALAADEMRITDHDSHIAEAVALVVVFIGMAFTLGSIWLALAAEICLAVGIGWTFGYTTIALGELNLLSLVFLMALIGIGMDYLVQILSAYRREARRRLRAKGIWTRVFESVGPPINTACLGAAGAFLVAIFTDFRGAAELGIVAGGGLLLCLLSGYTVLPALLTLFPPKLRMVDSSERYTGKLARAGGWRLAAPLTWALLLLIGVPFAMRTRFNPNLLDLQVKKLASVKLVRKLQTWSAVTLSRDLNVLRAARAAVEKSPLVARTESILDAYDSAAWIKQHHDDIPAIAWVTPEPITAEQLKHLADRASAAATVFGSTDAAAPLTKLVEKLREDDPRFIPLISNWQKLFVAQLREMMDQLSPEVDLEKLPAELRNHLVSADGVYALYIYPKDDLWQQDKLARFVQDVEQRIAPVPGNPLVTGIAPNIFHSTSSIENAFYKATAAAIVLIVLLVFIDLRSVGQTLMAVSVLAFGLPMLVAIMGFTGITWNFANFFGLPILIGAGHEYGVFLVHRYQEAARDPRRAWRSWDTSDRALLLCAFITSSSFGFFWALSSHEGLRSLGQVMALGSASIYLAALLVLRPLLLWKLTKLEHPQSI